MSHVHCALVIRSLLWYERSRAFVRSAKNRAGSAFSRVCGANRRHADDPRSLCGTFDCRHEGTRHLF
jgi:hypothetical protein